MDFLERDLEDILYNSSNKKLQERGLPLKGKKFRQVSIGGYGRTDLICLSRMYDPTVKRVEPFLEINVIELKKGAITNDTFFQALKYCKGIQRYCERKDFYNYSLKITLIGHKIDLSISLCYLPDLINFPFEISHNGQLYNISLYEYKYDIDGITFEEISGYKLTDEAFYGRNVGPNF